jgi:hypothetical protein
MNDVFVLVQIAKSFLPASKYAAHTVAFVHANTRKALSLTVHDEGARVWLAPFNVNDPDQRVVLKGAVTGSRPPQITNRQLTAGQVPVRIRGTMWPAVREAAARLFDEKERRIRQWLIEPVSASHECIHRLRDATSGKVLSVTANLMSTELIDTALEGAAPPPVEQQFQVLRDDDGGYAFVSVCAGGCLLALNFGVEEAVPALRLFGVTPRQFVHVTPWAFEMAALSPDAVFTVVRDDIYATLKGLFATEVVEASAPSGVESTHADAPDSSAGASKRGKARKTTKKIAGTDLGDAAVGATDLADNQDGTSNQEPVSEIDAMPALVDVSADGIRIANQPLMMQLVPWAAAQELFGRKISGSVAAPTVIDATSEVQKMPTGGEAVIERADRYAVLIHAHNHATTAIATPPSPTKGTATMDADDGAQLMATWSDTLRNSNSGPTNRWWLTVGNKGTLHLDAANGDQQLWNGSSRSVFGCCRRRGVAAWRRSIGHH